MPNTERTSEKEWSNLLQPRLDKALLKNIEGEWTLRACAGEKLTYAHEVSRYHADDTEKRYSSKYETDLLLYDTNEQGDWIPRVVIELKLAGITTHDALTYSTKASTHKHVHPYLRYGILVGNFDTALPGRLIRHGTYFDFMIVWPAEHPSKREWSDFVGVLIEEAQASRCLQSLLTESRQRQRKRYQILHRPLRLK
ncbi:MAG: hypothetical protein JNJ77_06780 [Planctomycetia bacterium]|nr:hypothetical protein [Planctomycetia bacterium]